MCLGPKERGGNPSGGRPPIGEHRQFYHTRSNWVRQKVWNWQLGCMWLHDFVWWGQGTEQSLHCRSECCSGRLIGIPKKELRRRSLTFSTKLALRGLQNSGRVLMGHKVRTNRARKALTGGWKVRDLSVWRLEEREREGGVS